MRKDLLGQAVAALWLLALFPIVTFSQVASLKPERPKWGESITVTYNPLADGAKFTPADEVYVHAVLSGWPRISKSARGHPQSGQ